uniref:Release factor glutamine methyltransferase n=1 Tax=Fundidesulfovibrio putealis TaxID=270496 RepID=A0A7C4AHN9_9BACT
MTKQPTVRDILAKTEAYLRDKCVDSPRLSAQILVAKGLGMDRMGLFLDMDRPLKPQELDALRPLVARRGRGEPVAYITGEREFYSLNFRVCPDVLIPRPETELIVEQALARCDAAAPLAFADLGCGSGCLGIALAAHLKAWTGVLLDASAAALEVARQNAVDNGVADRLEFVHADFSRLPARPGGYALIVSNPPYVSQAEHRELSPEVAGFEPLSALVPGPSGLEAYPVVAAVAARSLSPGGLLALEIGCGQGQAVKALLESAEYGFTDVDVLKDLAGLDRVVLGRLPS